MALAWSLVAIALSLLALAAAAYFWRPRRPARRTPMVQIKRRFHLQREGLEAKFIRLAAAKSQSKPNIQRWSDCTFADDVAYVRNRTTGELSAFVALTVEADDFQMGTAVFRFDQDHWATDGRAILNLSPTEAVRYYHEDFEMVGEEPAHRW